MKIDQDEFFRLYKVHFQKSAGDKQKKGYKAIFNY